MQTAISSNDLCSPILLRLFPVGVLLLIGGWSLFFMGDDLIKRLTMEDGVVENLGAFSWLVASILCASSYFRNKTAANSNRVRNQNGWWFVLLAFLFLFAAGEEISWGQRIFDFDTPESLRSMNRQGEFNFHNLGAFHGLNSSNDEKSGFARWITGERLFALFWFGYCVLLPLLVLTLATARRAANSIGIPVPPLLLGALFAMNHITHKLVELSSQDSPSLLWPAVEIKETMFAVLFALLSLYFYLLTSAENAVAPVDNEPSAR